MVSKSSLHDAGAVNVVVSAATLLVVVSARNSRPAMGTLVARGAAAKSMPAAGATVCRNAIAREY